MCIYGNYMDEIIISRQVSSIIEHKPNINKKAVKPLITTTSMA